MKELYDQVFVLQVRNEFGDVSRHKWPSVARLTLDRRIKTERAIVEDAYSRYPQCSRRGALKRELRSSRDDEFVPAWAELRVWDFVTSRGFEAVPEPDIPGTRGKPDFALSWPVATSVSAEGILEVTIAFSGSMDRESLGNKVRQELEEKAGKYRRAGKPYIVAILIGGPFVAPAPIEGVQDFMRTQSEAAIAAYRNLSAVLIVYSEERGDRRSRWVTLDQRLYMNPEAVYPLDETACHLLSPDLTCQEAQALAKATYEHG